MKKKAILAIIITAMLFVPGKALALSSSSIGAGGTSGGIANVGGNWYNYFGYYGLRVSLVDSTGTSLASKDYYDPNSFRFNASWPLYYTNKKNKTEVRETGASWVKGRGSHLSDLDPIPGGISVIIGGGNKTTQDYGEIKRYFENMAENGDNVKEYIKSSLNYDVDAISCEGKPYLLIEPLQLIGHNEGRTGDYFFGTVTELADFVNSTPGIEGNMTGGLRNSFNYDFGKLLIIPTETHGFNKLVPVGSNLNGITIGISELAKGINGYGVGIVWLEDLECKKCYAVKTYGTSAKCYNTGKPNIGTFWEDSDEVDCKSGDATEDATEHGKKVYEGNGCTINCLEKATQIYPGNVEQRVTIGRYLVWPTGANTHEVNYNQYSLMVYGRTTCVIEGKNKDSCRGVSTNQIYQFDADLAVKWNDGETEKNAILTKDTPKYTRIDSGDNILITSIVNYTLKDNFNRYINYKGEYVDAAPTEGRYIDLGYGNLSVSNKAKIGTKYDLKIVTYSLGGDGGKTFKGIANSEVNTNNDYKCNYKVVTDTPCECPPESLNAGKDLSSYLYANNNGDSKTCAELKEMYCNSPWNPPDDDVSCYTCPVGSSKEGLVVKNGKEYICNNTEDIEEEDLCDESSGKKYYCDAPYRHINLTPCLKSGGTISRCKEELCKTVPGGSNTVDDLKCPNTNGVVDDSMNVRLAECVKVKVGQGSSLSSAINVCEMQVCSLKGGYNVIYRVIDLHNPFPGKDFSGRVRGFNDADKGRNPGQNWNSKTLVTSKIRNNRKVDGDAVYSKKTLYRFVLTPSIIKSIRNYNSKNQYDDFNLKCSKTNVSSACISSFVHNPIYGLESGDCSSINERTFYTCVNK